ncbi:hypothetical protein A2U01_0012061, partial [Trifolium medium]|nr:hypothetical protein [Trifolium medium]
LRLPILKLTDGVVVVVVVVVDVLTRVLCRRICPPNACPDENSAPHIEHS